MHRDNGPLIPIHFHLNGRAVKTRVRPNQTLVQFLRDELHNWEVKEGCGNGNCGACAVLVDNVPRLACLMLAVQIDGAHVTTASGLGDSEHLHPLQEAFIRHGAIQCGFCTPGMLIAAKHLLDNNPRPTREEIREAISGNLCRCTGYQKIIEAIEDVCRASSVDDIEEALTTCGLVGASVPRVDALDKALGITQYAQDYTLPGMLHAGVLRSPYASARIVSIDATSARQLEGVYAVVTAHDIAGQKTIAGPLKIKMPVLAS